MRLSLKVKPNARISQLECGEDGVWTAHIKSPPVDGRANAELIKLLARHFKRPQSSIGIKSGGSGRMKIVDIAENSP